ncbi:MAG: septum formation initiator family protein [Saccharospirillum sp.]|uniref:septum formation initiator family protein n=1 Tax=Saccharospirillum TaxID=231683 RepID=UPI001FE33445|nr:septum formation initiator family protein [Saccharospirillum alexandrii]
MKATAVPQLQRKNPLRWLQIGLLVLLVMLQFRWWLGENSWVDVSRLEADVAAQESINAERRARNEVLSARVADLKSGLDAVEELGRSDLGLIRPGEVFYVIPAE